MDNLPNEQNATSATNQDQIVIAVAGNARQDEVPEKPSIDSTQLKPPKSQIIPKSVKSEVERSDASNESHPLAREVEGFPSRTEPIPQGTSLVDICRRFPNHLIGEVLDQFIGVMTARQIFDLMPKAAQDQTPLTTNRPNFLQKRLVSRRKKLTGSEEKEEELPEGKVTGTVRKKQKLGQETEISREIATKLPATEENTLEILSRSALSAQQNLEYDQLPIDPRLFEPLPEGLSSANWNHSMSGLHQNPFRETRTSDHHSSESEGTHLGTKRGSDNHGRIIEHAEESRNLTPTSETQPLSAIPRLTLTSETGNVQEMVSPAKEPTEIIPTIDELLRNPQYISRLGANFQANQPNTSGTSQRGRYPQLPRLYFAQLADQARANVAAELRKQKDLLEDIALLDPRFTHNTFTSIRAIAEKVWCGNVKLFKIEYPKTCGENIQEPVPLEGETRRARWYLNEMIRVVEIGWKNENRSDQPLRQDRDEITTNQQSEEEHFDQHEYERAMVYEETLQILKKWTADWTRLKLDFQKYQPGSDQALLLTPPAPHHQYNQRTEVIQGQHQNPRGSIDQQQNASVNTDYSLLEKAVRKAVNREEFLQSQQKEQTINLAQEQSLGEKVRRLRFPEASAFSGNQPKNLGTPEMGPPSQLLRAVTVSPSHQPLGSLPPPRSPTPMLPMGLRTPRTNLRMMSSPEAQELIEHESTKQQQDQIRLPRPRLAPEYSYDPEFEQAPFEYVNPQDLLH